MRGLVSKVKNEIYYYKYSIILFLVGVVFIVAYTGYKLQSKSTQENVANGYLVLNDNTVEQYINCDVDNVSTISFRFGTFQRENEGSLQAALYDSKDNMIQQWSISLLELENGEDYQFNLEDSLIRGNQYKFVITVKPTGEEDEIALYTSAGNQKVDDYIIIDGVEEYTTTADFKLWYSAYSGTIIFIEIILGFACIVSIVLAYKRKEIAYRLMTIGCVGICYFVLIPVFAVPDENTHYFRSYEISYGSWTSGYGDDGKGISYLPVGVDFDGEISGRESSGVYSLEKELWNKKIDMQNITIYSNPNQCLYAPLSYLPQSIGIFVARHISKNAMLIFYMGRLFNFIAGILCLYFSMKWFKENRSFIFLIAMMPMFLQEMISYAADAIINMLSILFIAYIWKLKHEQNQLQRIQYLAIIILAIMIALCKVVYFPLVLLVFCIPNWKFKDNKHAITYKITVLALAIASFGYWFKISMTYLQTGGGNAEKNVNTSEQIHFVLNHMFEFIRICVNSTFSNWNSWLCEMIGSQLGWRIIEIDGMIILIFIGLLVFRLTLSSDNSNVILYSRKEKLIILIMFLGIIALTYASLYVQWTPVRNKLIEGIQGRYFIPLLLLIPFFIKKHIVYIDKIKYNIFEIVVLYTIQIMCICSIYEFYV